MTAAGLGVDASRSLLQQRLRELDSLLDRLEPLDRGAQKAFEKTRRESEQMLEEAGAKWRTARQRFAQVRAERERVFRDLQKLSE